LIGYGDGRADAFSEYGHKPWQQGYKDSEREDRDTKALYRFQAEWAMRHGPKYTANNADFGQLRILEDSAEVTAERRKLWQTYRRKGHR
jgi:hypothetical protein